VKNVYELEQVFSEIIKFSGENIIAREFVHITQDLRVGALPNSLIKPIIPEGHRSDKVLSIDEKDILILKSLSDDARIPFHEISGKTNLSADAISYRVKNLEKC